MLPLTQAGEVLLVATHCEDSQARWDHVPDSLGGHWDGNDFLLLGESGIRLRGAKDPGWDYLQGGNFPALVPEGSQAPVVALADITVTCGAGPGWALALNADGTTTATSPDGRRTYRSHGPPGEIAA
jgi:hypothetical protein